MGPTRTFAAGRVRIHRSLNLTWQTGKEHSIGSQFQDAVALDFGRLLLPGVVEDSMLMCLPEVEHREATLQTALARGNVRKTRNSSLEPTSASGTLAKEKERA